MTEREKDRVQRLMARGVDQFLAQLLGMHWPEALPLLNAKLVDAAAAWGDVADAINAALDRIEQRDCAKSVRLPWRTRRVAA